MENNNLSHIVNNTIEYRFNRQNIKLSISEINDEVCALTIDSILGMNVYWELPSFNVTNIYEYFETKIFNDIESVLFSEDGIKQSDKKNLIDWVPDKIIDELKLQLMDFALTMNIEWNVMLQTIDRFGEAGYLNQTLYHCIITGYFESISKNYFNINLDNIEYTTPKGNGQTTITFLNGSNITVYKDFFTGFNFYNELTRQDILDAFLADIRYDTKVLICNQTNSY